jgi:hypothetical protein
MKTKLFRNQTVSLGGRLFRRPKLTLSCSAEGQEGCILYKKENRSREF